ncbi:hypothetical protein ACIF8T_34965 [Streptomyces sp. NPDC085946]|uniref:hypothetical protein n=1 Tax=Streptomyces sp. NPDC085946 TaxID=3365744 RepID=UPI0037CF1B6D
MLTARDYQQIALQLTRHPRVAADARRRADQLLKDSGPRALAGIVLREAEGRLSASLEGTAHCDHSRVRLIRTLYERLSRLESRNRHPGRLNCAHSPVTTVVSWARPARGAQKG